MVNNKNSKSDWSMNMISKDITEIKIGVARIEEHIKKVDTDVARHEDSIKCLETDVANNKIELAKLGAIAGVSGGVTGGVVFFVTKLIGM
jgi:hypothetical protein